MHNTRTIGALAGAALAAAALPATAQTYDGATIELVTNASPGGATGLGAQIAADHWAEELEGNPNVVVQSVPGGNLSRGIYQVMNARPDGMTLGWVAWGGAVRAVDAPELQIPFEDFEIIGGVGGPGHMLSVRADTGDGIEEPEDFVELEETVTFGGFGPNAMSAISAAASLDMLGVDWSFVSGFAGDGPLHAAQLRGEIDVSMAVGNYYDDQLKDGPIADGEIIPLYYFSAPTEDGTALQEDPIMPELEPFSAYYERVMGEAPSGPEWELIKFRGGNVDQLIWLVVAPPDTPEDIVEELRTSFEAAMTSDGFVEEATELYGSPPIVTFGEETVAMVDEVQNMPEEMQELIRDYISRLEG